MNNFHRTRKALIPLVGNIEEIPKITKNLSNTREQSPKERAKLIEEKMKENT